MQLIADILSFDHNQEQLEAHFKQASMNWDAIVIIGSKHLMLPALYCRLKAKNLLNLIPGDLNVYLEEIAAINRGRNEVLLAEAHEITELFKKENIDHVFIKGLALLAGETFEDPAERMIGDMDILVPQNQLKTAFNILTNHGYNDTIKSIIERKNRRHLPRQISQQKFGAIEIHSEVLIHKYRHLIINDNVLKNKRIVNGIAIPSIEDAVKIAILALQINDKAHFYGYFNYKTIYDCLALKLPSNHVLLENLCEEKHSQSFLKLSTVFFKDLMPYKASNYSVLLTTYYIFKLNYPKSGRFIASLVNLLINIYTRLNLLVSNKSYRTHILRNKIALKSE